MKLLPLAMALGMLLSVAPPAAAFHGSPYVLTGTAVFGPTGQTWDVRLEWSGAGGAGGQFRVTLADPVSGAKLPAVAVAGRENIPVAAWLNAPGCVDDAPEPFAVEVVSPYRGYDSQTGGKMLEVTGLQENCLGFGVRNGDRYMVVAGSFLQHWDLVASTGTTFGTPYE